MPVSPHDFSLWARATGNEYPNSVEEKARLAPEVHNFARNYAKPGAIGAQEPEEEGEIEQKQSNLGSNLAKAALLAGGVAATVAAARDPRVQRGFQVAKESVINTSDRVKDFLQTVGQPSTVDMDVVNASGDVTPNPRQQQAAAGPEITTTGVTSPVTREVPGFDQDGEYIHPSRIPGMEGGDYRGRNLDTEATSATLRQGRKDNEAGLFNRYQETGEIPASQLSPEQKAALRIPEEDVNNIINEAKGQIKNDQLLDQKATQGTLTRAEEGAWLQNELNRSGTTPQQLSGHDSIEAYMDAYMPKERSAERDLEGQQRAEVNRARDYEQDQQMQGDEYKRNLAQVEASGEPGVRARVENLIARTETPKARREEVSPKFDANQLSDLSNLIESYEMGSYTDQSPNDEGMSAWQKANPDHKLSHTPAEYDKLAGLLSTAADVGKERTLNTKSATAIDNLLTNLQNDKGAYADYGELHSDVGRALGRSATYPNRQDIDIEDKRQYEIATQGHTNIEQPSIFRNEAQYGYDSEQGVYRKGSGAIENLAQVEASGEPGVRARVENLIRETETPKVGVIHSLPEAVENDRTNSLFASSITPDNQVPKVDKDLSGTSLTSQHDIEMEADNAIDNAKARLGLSSENLSAKDWVANERASIQKGLIDSGFKGDPRRLNVLVERELADRMGKDAWTYGPEYTRRRQSTEIGLMDPALLEDPSKRTVNVSGETFDRSEFEKPVAMEATAKRLEERKEKQRDWSGQIHLEQQSTINGIYQERKALAEQQGKQVAKQIEQASAAGDQRTVQALTPQLNNLRELWKDPSKGMHRQGEVKLAQARIRGVQRTTEEKIAGMHLPTTLSDWTGEGKRIFFEQEPSTGQVNPATVELRSGNRPSRSSIIQDPQTGEYVETGKAKGSQLREGEKTFYREQPGKRREPTAYEFLAEKITRPKQQAEVDVWTPDQVSRQPQVREINVTREPSQGRNLQQEYIAQDPGIKGIRTSITSKIDPETGRPIPTSRKDVDDQIARIKQSQARRHLYGY